METVVKIEHTQKDAAGKADSQGAGKGPPKSGSRLKGSQAQGMQGKQGCLTIHSTLPWSVVLTHDLAYNRAE